MRKIDRIALVVTLLLGTSGLATADETEILKAHFKAVGGLDRLSEIKTVKRSGAAKMGGVFGEMAGTIEEVVVVGKKSYYEMDLGMHHESTLEVTARLERENDVVHEPTPESVGPLEALLPAAFDRLVQLLHEPVQRRLSRPTSYSPTE